MHRITSRITFNLASRIKVLTLCGLCAALFTFASACSTSNIVTYLNGIVAAADSAVGVLEATGQVSPQTGNLISGYLSNVSTAASESAMELQSGDTTAVKVSTITDFFSTSVIPNIAGVPASVIGPVQAVDSAVKAFLASIGTSIPANRKAVALAGSSWHNVPDHIHVSRYDRAKLKEITLKGLAVAQKANAIRR